MYYIIRFKNILARILFQNFHLKYWGCINPLTTLYFDSLPYPWVRRYKCFRQNGRNGSSNNVLCVLGHFLLPFKATGKSGGGVATTPLVTKGLKIINLDLKLQSYGWKIYFLYNHLRGKAFSFQKKNHNKELLCL